jgi:hypothetical protein
MIPLMMILGLAMTEILLTHWPSNYLAEAIKLWAISLNISVMTSSQKATQKSIGGRKTASFSISK